ncbi:MAG: hypothetical protein GF370_03335, partial [Candidatus Nealsonbacteria bacterium]|nr:hypothetical protein [Candidatus Nealsonbacteria bacterium]
KGRRKSVSKDMKKRMKELSEKREYEKAALLRDRIESLDKIIAHARIIREFKIKRGWSKREKRLKKLLGIKDDISRIEAYDVSNIQGKKATGSMVVFIEGEPDKILYRKFKIKRERKPNDIAMLKEVLSRRFNHPEWKFPEIILIDGGKAQLNVAIRVKNKNKRTKDIKVVSVAKKDNRLFIEGRESPLFLRNLPRTISNLILKTRDEAHRFAIKYHKNLREKGMLGR